MNKFSHAQFSDADLRRRARLFTILEQICRELELTDTQFERSRQAYSNAAQWLTASDNPLLKTVQVYPHGSVALRTTVKPIAYDEFDVDLIAFATGVSDRVAPALLKEAFGKRLAEHKTFAEILEEKKRCWRLNYAGDFHLDISPTILNPNCRNGGELVPDRNLHAWHPTNPKAYRKRFEARAKIMPRLSQRSIWAAKDQTPIEPFPSKLPIKGILRRTVQLLKRHRDLYFLDTTEEVAPISIIITTLAMRAYEFAVNQSEFEGELEVVIETIRHVPRFIEARVINGQLHYAVWNETTNGENFADRWNTEPARVKACYNWHENALADFEALQKTAGLDEVSRQMGNMFGVPLVKKIFRHHSDKMSLARRQDKLLVAPALGLSTVPSNAAAPVHKNDFFGD